VRGEATFIMDGQPAEGRSVAELEAALRAEIVRIQTAGITPEELARVKTQLIAGQTYKRDSLMAQAMEIGGMEAVGLSWRDVDLLVDQLKGVTAAEVQAVARKYFTDDTLTIAVLDPQPMDAAAPEPSANPAIKTLH
jgi:zinc protease